MAVGMRAMGFLRACLRLGSDRAVGVQVNIEVMRPWVTKKVTAYLGLEDDIVINMVMAELEKEDEPDPRRMQVNLTGFLERNTGAFMGELWSMCISAQANFAIDERGKAVKGMPAQLLKEKEDEIMRINKEIQERASKKRRSRSARMNGSNRRNASERENARHKRESTRRTCGVCSRGRQQKRLISRSSRSTQTESAGTQRKEMEAVTVSAGGTETETETETGGEAGAGIGSAGGALNARERETGIGGGVGAGTVTGAGSGAGAGAGIVTGSGTGGAAIAVAAENTTTAVDWARGRRGDGTGTHGDQTMRRQ